MAPEDAFTTIANAVAEIEDPMTQAKVATELFKKAGEDLIQTFENDMPKVGAAVTVMSDETIARLKAAQDQWTSWMNTITVASADVISSVIKVTTSWREFGIGLATAAIPIPGIREKLGSLIDGLRDFDPVFGSASQAASEFGATVAMIPPPADAVVNSLKPVAVAAADVDRTIGEMNQTFRFSTK